MYYPKWRSVLESDKTLSKINSLVGVLLGCRQLVVEDAVDAVLYDGLPHCVCDLFASLWQHVLIRDWVEG